MPPVPSASAGVASPEDPPQGPVPFRREALEYHLQGGRTYADVVWLPRAWLRWAYRLPVGTALVGALFLALTSVNQYARGPCIIRAAPITAGRLHFQALLALPASIAPELRVGQEGRLQIPGVAEGVAVRVDSLSGRIVSADVASRDHGFAVAELAPLGSAVVLAETELDEGGRYLDGMRGEVQVKVGSTRLWAMFVPWNKATRE